MVFDASTEVGARRAESQPIRRVSDDRQKNTRPGRLGTTSRLLPPTRPPVHSPSRIRSSTVYTHAEHRLLERLRRFRLLHLGTLDTSDSEIESSIFGRRVLAETLALDDGTVHSTAALHGLEACL